MNAARLYVRCLGWGLATGAVVGGGFGLIIGLLAGATGGGVYLMSIAVLAGLVYGIAAAAVPTMLGGVASQTAPAAAFAATGVPARVEALLQRPPAGTRWCLLSPANLGVAAILLAAEAAHDLERLFELATRLTH